MGLHCDLAISLRSWHLYFTTLIDCLRRLIKTLRHYNLLEKIDDLTVWEGYHMTALGGIRQLHAPLSAPIESFLEVIEKILKKELKQENIPRYLSKKPAISFRLEGLLKLKLPDGELHQVPFDVMSVYRLRRVYQGDLYLRTFKYHGYTFADFFIGNDEFIKWNREQLLKALEAFTKNNPYLKRVFIGYDADSYNNVTQALYIFRRSEEKYIEDLLETAKMLLKNYKEQLHVPPQLEPKDLQVLYRDLQPINRKYITRKIIKHPFYTEDIPEIYKEYNIIKQEGSLILYHKDFKPMEDIHATILKQISSALQKALKPKEKFDSDLERSLNELHKKRKKLTT